MSRLLLSVTLLSVLSGCAAEPEESWSAEPSAANLALEAEEQANPESMSEEDNPHVEVDLISQGDASLLPYVEPMVRARQRLNINQLEASLLRATGGHGWTEVKSGEEVSLFESLRDTLGVPDYIESTREDLSTSTLFHRFLDEAARDACTKLVTSELETPVEDRILMRHVSETDTVQSNPAGVDENLRYLLMRYHGYHAAPDSPALAGWRWLFQSVAHGAQSPSQAWRSVCVGLITHPYFYSH